MSGFVSRCCGVSLLDNESYCPECGTPVSWPVELTFVPKYSPDDQEDDGYAD